MYKQKIGISIGSDYGVPTSEALKIIKEVGFDAVSPFWKGSSELAEEVETSARLGLEVQSLHAPFNRAAAMWSADASVSEPVKKELFECIDSCERFAIPVMVVHTWIGFDYTFDKDSLYFGNFEELVEYAESKNVKIAFENTEGEEYLFALMDHFENNETVGFCWDSGHELCYNRSADLLARFGERLIMTHLNDNLGISRFDGKIFWTDDLHLLPYDGITNWDHSVARLKKSKYMPILNLELAIKSKPGRHDNDVYSEMPLVGYLTEAYKRACRIAYNYAMTAEEDK